MKDSTDSENETDNSEFTDNSDGIDLIEKVEKSNLGDRIKGLEKNKTEAMEHDEEIILLKEEVHVNPEDNDDYILLTDEVSMTNLEKPIGSDISQKNNVEQKNPQIKYVVIPIEAFSEKIYDHIPGLSPGNSGLMAIPTEILDDSIERVIHKMFADKIDFMIREATEKILTETLEKLRKKILHQHRKDMNKQ